MTKVESLKPEMYFDNPRNLMPEPYSDEISLRAFREAEEIKNNPNSKGFRSIAELLEDLESHDD